MTKTIHDAWVALKGDLRNSYNHHGGESNLHWNINSERYGTSYGEHTEQPYQNICTTEEFINYKGDNMKTIMDAVNELKGEWPDFTGLLFGDSKARIGYSITDRLKIELVGSACNTKAYPITYSEQDFNDLVSQLETNFGNSPTIEEYNKMIKNIDWKNIDWSKAPEYYDYHLQHRKDKSNSGFCCSGTDGRFYFSNGDRATDANEWFMTTRPQPTIIAIDDKPLIPIDFGAIPDDKPVYTQEMFDGNELPGKGMLCKYRGVKKVVIAPMDANNKLVLASIDNGIYSLAHCNDIEPIPLSITLVDGWCYQFNVAKKTITVKGFYCESENELVYINGTVNPTLCTNIKPLTVGE